ncbi:hypothetical protein [Pseudomonas sp.]|uniref:hypothetical protein n=1 Tax=Pseudomonas sp. TaxID=306 RepID=UPI00257C5C3A|nr:hypothetical protein [Pseudomonas sp.]
MNKPHWHTSKLDDGSTLVAVDLMVNGTLIGLREAVPELLTNDAEVLRTIIRDMGVVLIAAHRASRACAFGG